jgi:NADH:ubiquinone oxidoreductase subunit 4 (subunit M)
MINHGISTGALFLLVGMIYERRHTRLIEDYGGIARIVPWFATILMIVTLSSIGLPGTNGFIGEFLILSGTFQAGLSSVLQAAPAPGMLQQLIAALLFAGLLIGILAVAYALFRDIEDPVIRLAVPAVLAVVALVVLALYRTELYNGLLAGVNSLRTWRNYSLAMGFLATTGVILGAIYMLSMYRRVLFGPVTQVKNQNIKDLTGREWAVLLPLVAAIFVIGFYPKSMLDKMSRSVDAFVERYELPMTARRSPETVPRLQQKALIENAGVEKAGRDDVAAADVEAQAYEAVRGALRATH